PSTPTCRSTSSPSSSSPATCCRGPRRPTGSRRASSSTARRTAAASRVVVQFGPFVPRITGPAGQTVPLPELVLFLHDVDDAAGVQPPPAEGTSLPATARPAKGLWPYPARTRPPGNDHQRSGAKTVEPTSAEGVAAEAPGASIR